MVHSSATAEAKESAARDGRLQHLTRPRECHDDWPEHKSVKEQLNAGTIGKVEEKVEKRQPSVAAKLLESRNIGEWPESDEMKQRIATNNTSAPSET